MNRLARTLLFLCLLATAAPAGPRHVYLTWQGDTSTTMTVNFQTLQRAENPAVHYRSGPEEKMKVATGTSHQIERLADGRWIHWIELKNLEPGQTYRFVAGDDAGGWSPEMKFKTIPAGHEPLRFIVGGDSAVTKDDRPFLTHAAKLAPQFVVIGGDLAYANGDPAHVGEWDYWLDNWQELMVTPDGCTVPLVVAIGNHEVPGGYRAKPEAAIFYYGFFAQNGWKSYFTRTFGADLSFHILDTNHTAPYDGPQRDWLEQALAGNAGRLRQMIAYHVGLYPSAREFGSAEAKAGRKHWLPLFDQYKVTTAFEHHDHTFKRTHLLRGGQRVEKDGTLYLGDGCFGRGPRDVNFPLAPGITVAGGIPHFWLVDLTTTTAEYRAVNKEGVVFDVYPENAKGGAEARDVFAGMEKNYRKPQKDSPNPKVKATPPPIEKPKTQ